MNNLIIFESNILAEHDNATSVRKYRRNKARKHDKNRNNMKKARVCTNDDTPLVGGVEYQINAVANIMPNATEGFLFTQELQSPVKFKIAEDSAKYLLFIRKRPRSSNVTAESRLQLKAKIKSCEDDNINGTASKDRENLKGATSTGGNEDELQVKGQSNSRDRNRKRNRNSGKGNKNRRNKGNRRDKNKGKQQSGNHGRGDKNKGQSSQKTNKSDKNNINGTKNKRNGSRRRNKHNDASKNFKVVLSTKTKLC